MIPPIKDGLDLELVGILSRDISASPEPEIELVRQSLKSVDPDAGRFRGSSFPTSRHTDPASRPILGSPLMGRVSIVPKQFVDICPDETKRPETSEGPQPKTKRRTKSPDWNNFN